MKDGSMKSEPETTMEKSQLQEDPSQSKSKSSIGRKSQTRTGGRQTEDVDDFFDDDAGSNESVGQDDGSDVNDE